MDQSESRAEWITIAALLALVGWFQAPYLLDREIVVERDALSSILPVRAFLARALEAGSWPMWNPAPVLGKPFLAEWQTGLFYPPSLLLLVKPFSQGFNLFFVFHYIWTALGAFLLLRCLGTSRPSAMLGALVWALGGPLVSLGHLLNHLMAISWLPWVLWGWARTTNRRHQILASTCLLAVALLTGSPEMALLIALLLLGLARDYRAFWVPILAALLAAVQLVPVWIYLARTYRGVHGLSEEGTLRFSTALQRMGEMAWSSASPPEAFLPSLYIGPIPLLLALGALLVYRSAASRLALLLGVLLLALALGANTAITPLLLGLVPGAGLLRYPEKLLVGVHALLALGAAWGLTAVAARLPARAATTACLLIVAIAGADLFRANRGALFSLAPREVLSAPEIARAMSRGEGTEQNPEPNRYYANTTGAPTPSGPRQAAEFDRDLLFAATGELYGLADVNTPSSLNLIAHERFHKGLETVSREQAVDALGALGTRWITSFVDMDETAGITPVPLSEGSTRLYEVSQSAPRAFFAQRVLIAANNGAALQRFLVATPEERPGLAIIEGIGTEDLGYKPPDTSTIHWREEANNRLRLEVSVDRAALLVVNDSFLAGWRAWVDGEPASMERVNGLVRGIWMRPGNHRVTMRYRSPGLPLGAALSLATLVALGLALFRPYRDGHERAEGEQPDPVQPRRILPWGR